MPDGPGGRQVQTRRFTTTTAGLVLLAEGLASFEVTRVGMEFDWVLLEAGLAAARDQLECWLVNAAHLHNVPGGKTDVAMRPGSPSWWTTGGRVLCHPARSGSCAS